MKIFHQVILENEEAFRKLGVGVGDLGSHSARKGSCSFASAGSTVSPPMVSICLRALWSMGPVKERYLHYEKAGDQYLGRVVLWEKSESTPMFTGIPPHVVILANFEGLKNKMERIRSEVHEDFSEEMDNRGVGGVAFLNQKAILKRMDELEGNLLSSMNGRKVTEIDDGDFVSTSTKVGTHPDPMTLLPCQRVTVQQSETRKYNFLSVKAVNSEDSLQVTNSRQWVSQV